MTVALERQTIFEVAEDTFRSIQGIDHLEFWVGNAYQAAQFYRSLFGFDIVAYAGPETGIHDRVSYVLRQGTIILVMTAGLTPESPIVQHVGLHGDSVHDVALRLDDVDAAFELAAKRGASPFVTPRTIQGRTCRVRRAAISTYG